MIVECEKCGTKFNVPPDRIKDEGSKVRCSSCKHVFMIYKPAPEPTPIDEAVPPPPVTPEPGPENGDDVDLGDDFGPDLTAGDDGPGLGDDLDDFDLGSPEDGDAFGADAAPAVDDNLGLGDDMDDFGLGDLEDDAFGADAAPAVDDDLGLGDDMDDFDLGGPEDDAFGADAAPAVDDDLGLGDDMDDLGLGGPEDDAFGADAAPAVDDDLGLGDDMDDLGLGGPEDDAFGADAVPAVDDDLGLSDDFGDLDLGAPEAGDDLSTSDDFAADDDLSFMNVEDSPSEDMDGADFGAIDLGEEPSVSGAQDDFGSADDDYSFDESDQEDSFDQFAEPSSDLGEDEELEDEDYDDEDGLLIGQDEEGLYGQDDSAPAKKKRGLLWFLVGLCFVLAAVGGVFNFAPELLDPILKPLGLGKVDTVDVKDDPMGKKYISPENAMHSYIKNEKEGQLLIITGQAKNHYPVPRSHIKVKGLLHDAKANVVAERQSFCGNILTKEELSTLPMDELMKRLSVKDGQKGANKNILPDQSVEFMIVFDKIPKDLAEYIVEIYSSEQGEPVK